jgi:hypothetical protein
MEAIGPEKLAFWRIPGVEGIRRIPRGKLGTPMARLLRICRYLKTSQHHTFGNSFI